MESQITINYRHCSLTRRAPIGAIAFLGQPTRAEADWVCASEPETAPDAVRPNRPTVPARLASSRCPSRYDGYAGVFGHSLARPTWPLAGSHPCRQLLAARLHQKTRFHNGLWLVRPAVPHRSPLRASHRSPTTLVFRGIGPLHVVFGLVALSSPRLPAVRKGTIGRIPDGAKGAGSIDHP
jgi:hypothetical protein